MFISFYNIEMNIVKIFNNLCTPVKLYFIYFLLINIIGLIAVYFFPHLMLHAIKKKKFEMHIKLPTDEVMFKLKFIYIFGFVLTFIWTYFLQLLCKKINKKFVWVVVAAMSLPSLFGFFHTLINLF